MVSYVESVREELMVDILNRLLQDDNVSFSCNSFLNSTVLFPRRGPGFQFIEEVVQLSASCRALTQGQSCRQRCLCRKSFNHSQHQSPFSRLKVIVEKSQGPVCSAASVRAFLRHASTRKCLHHLNRPHLAQSS